MEAKQYSDTEANFFMCCRSLAHRMQAAAHSRSTRTRWPGAVAYRDFFSRGYPALSSHKLKAIWLLAACCSSLGGAHLLHSTGALAAAWAAHTPARLHDAYGDGLAAAAFCEV